MANFVRKNICLFNHIMLNLKNDFEYLSPETRVVFLHSLQILCGSDDINGIDTEIDENPDNWL